MAICERIRVVAADRTACGAGLVVNGRAVHRRFALKGSIAYRLFGISMYMAADILRGVAALRSRHRDIAGRNIPLVESRTFLHCPVVISALCDGGSLVLFIERSTALSIGGDVAVLLLELQLLAVRRVADDEIAGRILHADFQAGEGVRIKVFAILPAHVVRAEPALSPHAEVLHRKRSRFCCKRACRNKGNDHAQAQKH